MNTQNNKWIDKVRKELTEYSPAYNDSDWKALKGKLPVPKGWLGLSKHFLNWLKVIVIASVTITIVTLFIQPKTNNTNSGKATETETVEHEENISDVKDYQENGLVNQKITDGIIDTKTISTPYENPDSSQNTVSRKASNSNQISGKRPEIKETTSISEGVQNDSIQQKKVIEKTVLPVNIENSFSNVPDLSGNETPKNIQNQIPENTKISSNSDSVSTNRENEKIIFDQEQPSNLKKENKKLFKEPLIYIPKTPFLIGVTYIISFETGLAPYQSKINALNGGLVFEKFISDKSSVAIKPQIHTKNFFNIIQKSDTVPGSVVPGDSLGLPPSGDKVIVTESEVTHNLDLVYLDFPLIYTRYFVRKNSFRLAFSSGISNKYFLSIKDDGNSASLNQSFYLAQSGLFSFKYQKVWNNNLFLEVEPFVDVPFRKISDKNYRWTSFGVNVSLLFDVSKK